ncbi:20 kDa chaperonin chloroplastic [Bienertia sinuspersici]
MDDVKDLKPMNERVLIKAQCFHQFVLGFLKVFLR